MAAPPILSCKSARKTMYILLTLYFIITPSLAQSINVALNKAVNQSSTLEYPHGNFWTGGQAVDGKEHGYGDVDNCHCCSSTNNDSINSLTVDLGEIYTIYSIYVLARPTGNNGRLTLAKMYISNTTSMAASPTYTHLLEARHFTWNATEGTFARYVKLTRPRDDFLIVCEIQVFKRDCSSSRYGPACAQECLNCASCNQTGGNCFTCTAGKYGNTCQDNCSVSCAEPSCEIYGGRCHSCVNGTFGVTCSNNCPPQCEGNVCDRMNGNCTTGCKPGYIGNNCNSPCPDGRYGHNCTATCGHCSEVAKCNKIDGICMAGCMPGYKPGFCTECDQGYFGLNCSSKCGQCLSMTMCNTQNGTCMTGCQPGFKPGFCTENCDDGHYGMNCTQECGKCANMTSCNKKNGTCMTGCTDGYQPGSCKQQCNTGTYGHHCNATCGHCNNMSECNPLNGTCMTGCLPGFKPGFCKDECDAGQYGFNCVQPCGSCSNITDCNKVNGTCMTGCTAGYQPGLCNQTCNPGNYGHHCNVQCGHCNNMTECNPQNGTCMTGCLPGFKPGLCKEECDEGKYGVNCAQFCGNCSTIGDCNKLNGTCMTGCTAGYQPGLCNHICTMQKFGVNCKETCHCADGVQCNVENGYCPGGNCTIGFGLQNCTKDVSLLPRLNGTFTTSQLTTYSNWSSTRAVDGKLERDADANSCQCCSATNATPTDKWWSIDLHQPYLVQYVQIYSRTSNGNPQQIKGIQMVIANTTDERGHIIFNDTSEHGEDVYNIEVIPVRPLQIVKILRNSPEPLTLCEVKILEKFCEVGHYGYNCSRMCNCGDNQTCHAVTGHCMSPSCLPGWNGSACEEACQPGSYGANCELACRCTDFTSCSRYDGSCGLSTCLPGYQETDCQTECDEGFYGQNCTSKCGNCATSPCSSIDGNCTNGCAKGVTGSLCKESLTQEASSSPVVGAAVGSVAAVVVIGIIAAVVYVRRNRFNFGRTPTSGNTLHKAENAAFDADAVKGTSDDTEENMYANWCEQPRQPKGILIYELYDYIKTNLVEKANGFNKQYNKLKNGLEDSHDAALLDQNRGKNRYKNMVAYDHSRVLLRDRAGDQSDYINACYINGHERVKKFIASQGPTDAMVEDFWHMVWQEKSDQIVMLTNLVELGAIKCIQYWPEEGSIVFGDITITLINTQTFSDYCVRTLEIRKRNAATRRVDQFHFQAWPDKNVPDSAWSLVNFWREVSRQKSDQSCPTVVHCSAGVGRTGTYIALDCLYNQAQKEGSVDVLSCVETLRHQRVNMVQTSTQYVYLHEAVAEALCIGTLPLLTSHFKRWYTEMLQVDTSTHPSRLETQHQLYQLSQGSNETSAPKGHLYSRLTGSKNVTAHLIKNYMHKEAFIVMVTGRSSKGGKLRQTIEEYQVKTVLNLSDTDTPTELNVDADVRFFDFTSWGTDGVPKTISDVSSLVERIQEWQPQQSETKPILLHSTSPDRCGMMYIILNELHRIQMDGRVSVLQAAKSMTSEDGSFIVTLNWEQYKFCHAFLLDHIEQTGMYQNASK